MLRTTRNWSKIFYVHFPGRRNHFYKGDLLKNAKGPRLTWMSACWLLEVFAWPITAEDTSEQISDLEISCAVIGSYISTSTCLYTRGIVVLDWISQSMWLDYMNTISDWNFQYGGPSSNDGGSLGYLRGGWGRSRRSCSTAWFSLTGRTCSINPQFLEVEREGKKAIMLIPAGFWPPCWGKVSWSYGWSLPRRHRASLPAAMRQLKVNSF